MIKVGITGQNGFIGTHLCNTLGLFSNEFQIIEFDRNFFESDIYLDKFVEQCDVIVHLSAMNRHKNQNIIYSTNIKLVKKIIESLERTNSRNIHILFSSSTQEENDNLYGRSKKDGRLLFENWAKSNNSVFTGLIVPNVFGPFGRPYYNSVIATFSHQLTHAQVPTIKEDNLLKLIYIGELVSTILKIIRERRNETKYFVEHTNESKVSEILCLLNKFKTEYLDYGKVPFVKNTFELNLFNTFRSYIDFQKIYPIKITQHTDLRGSFVEVVRLGIGGQVSFSTTMPGITRGNHFHTRKIERFTVINGKAIIQLRKIGTDNILNFYVDGKEPSYVDMPIWYTHNIKNIGDEILYTIFWISEPYDEKDSDTFFEKV